MSYRRDSILKHLVKEKSGKRFGEKGCADKVVYEVDADSFTEFQLDTINPALEFLPLKTLRERMEETEAQRSPTPPATIMMAMTPVKTPTKAATTTTVVSAPPKPATPIGPISAAVRPQELRPSRKERKEQKRAEKDERRRERQE